MTAFDWTQNRLDYEARLQWEKENGYDPVELRGIVTIQKEARLKPKPSRSGIGGSAPTYSRSHIVRLYQEGMTVPYIAEEVGCNKQTVYTHLKAANVERRDDRKTLKGPPRRTHCVKRNHELTPENTRVDGLGNRSCISCAAIRDREKKESKRAC